ncbi:MAG: Npt1/Npt2 family nucleotide transporter [Leeuwenhoekiella sp.]
MIEKFLNKTFNIRDGELAISFYMQLYVFLIITVLLIVKPTINALFINKLGASSLAYAFLFIAISAILSNYFYNQAVRRFSLKRIIIATILSFALSFAILGGLLIFEDVGTVTLYIFYVIAGIFAVLTTSQFWLVANMVFNAREAKRLFGFIGSGAIAGGIFGGYLTNILATNIGNASLLLLAGGILLMCIPIMLKIYQRGKLNGAAHRYPNTAEKSNEEPALRTILKSKHLTYVAIILGISVIVAKLVDFQFSDFASRKIPDPDDLASFFGFWFSTFNLVSLAIQLFLTNRLVNWLGVNSSLLILPLGIALGSLLFLTVPELWVLILIKGIDGSFKQSVNKAGMELVMVPVPLAVKNTAKSFIDVVVDSAATGIAGCLLIFVIKGLSLSTNYVTVIILLLLFIWLVGIFKVRDTYFKSFRESLKSAVSDQRKLPVRSRKTNLQVSRSILQEGTPEEILIFLDNLNKQNAKRLKAEIVSLLDHSNPEVQQAAIKQLYFYPPNTERQRVRNLVYTKNELLVQEALNYLIVHTSSSDNRIFDSYLNHSSPYIAHAALLCLSRESQKDRSLAGRFNLELRLELWLAEMDLPDSQHQTEEYRALLTTIGYAGLSKFYSFISVNFNNRNVKVVQAAIDAAGISQNPVFIDALIDFLETKTFRKAAQKALRNYGDFISKELLNRDREKMLKNSSKRHVPTVIQKFETQNAVGVLLQFLRSSDVTIRLAAARSLSIMKGKASNLNFRLKTVQRFLMVQMKELYQILGVESAVYNKSFENMTNTSEDDIVEIDIARNALREAIGEQIEERLETVFKLLAVLYNRKDIGIAYVAYKSQDANTKANTIEFLDNILSPKLKTRLLPLLEASVAQRADENLEYFGKAEYRFNDALLYLLKNGDAKVRLPALYLIQYLGDTDFIPQLTHLMKTAKNKEVRSFTEVALRKTQAINSSRSGVRV